MNSQSQSIFQRAIFRKSQIARNLRFLRILRFAPDLRFFKFAKNRKLGANRNLRATRNLRQKLRAAICEIRKITIYIPAKNCRAAMRHRIGSDKNGQFDRPNSRRHVLRARTVFSRREAASSAAAHARTSADRKYAAAKFRLFFGARANGQSQGC